MLNVVPFPVVFPEVAELAGAACGGVLAHQLDPDLVAGSSHLFHLAKCGGEFDRWRSGAVAHQDFVRCSG
jgi:hypothetical protein